MKTIKLSLMAVAVFFIVQLANPVQASTRIQGSEVMVTRSTNQGETIPPSELETFSDTFMAGQMAAFQVPGAAVMVVQDGQVILSKGYGVANLAQQTPMTADTPIRPASLAKVFAFTGVLQMYERGVWQLSDSVDTYLTSPLPDEGYDPMTFHNLLTHTEGFEDRTVGVVAPSADGIKPIQVHFAETQPGRIMPPGEMITYGNFGAVLSSVLLEQQSGQSFAAYMDENIFQPLGMTQTTFVQPVPAQLLENLATEYNIDEGSPQPIPVIYPQIVAGGGITSSPADMGKFMRMVLQGGAYEGGRVLQAETAVMMLERQFGSHPDLPGTTYGFMEHFENGTRAVRRDGYGMQSRSRIFLMPEENIGIFLYYNNGENDLRNAFFSQFLDQFYPADAEALAPAASADSLKVDGIYAAVQTDNHTYGKLQMLFAGLSKVSHDENNSMTITPLNYDAYSGIEEESHWIETSPSFYQRTDGDEGRLSFMQLNKQTYLLTGTGMLGTYRRLAWYETPLFQSVLTGISLLLFIVTLVVGTIGLKRALTSGTSIQQFVPMAWSLSLIVSIVGLIFLTVAFYGIFVKDGMLPLMPAYALGTTNFVKVVLAFSWVLLALVVAFTITTAMLWTKDVSTTAKVYMTVLCLFSIAYIWLLQYWNLLGIHV